MRRAVISPCSPLRLRPPLRREPLVPHPPKGKGEHCVAPTEFMRRNHMSMMKHQRDETVHEGVRGKPFSLAGCMDCHAVKGADGQPVAYADSRHFCRSCHDFAAVSIDCFECHSSKAGVGKSAKRTKDRSARTWPLRRLSFRRSAND